MQQKGVQPQFSMQGGHLIMAHQEQTGLPKVKDASMNDRDRMQDLLAAGEVRDLRLPHGHDRGEPPGAF